jgi:hypothetical protein
MTPADVAVQATARHKIARRLFPFLFLVYITAYIDRVNVGFAGLDMTRKAGDNHGKAGAGGLADRQAAGGERGPLGCGPASPARTLIERRLPTTGKDGDETCPVVRKSDPARFG